MSEITKDKLVGALIKCMPYPEQMNDFDTQSEKEAIRFSWRGMRFRCSLSGYTETVGDGVLIGDGPSILLRALLVNVLFN